MNHQVENTTNEKSGFFNHIKGLESTSTSPKKNSDIQNQDSSKMPVVNLGNNEKQRPQEKKIKDFNIFYTYALKGTKKANELIDQQVREIAREPGHHYQEVAKMLVKWADILNVRSRLVLPASYKTGAKKESLESTIFRFLDTMRGTEHIMLWEEMIDNAIKTGYISRSTERFLVRKAHQYQLEYINR